MSLPSPTLEGFRATFRRPSAIFAEIAWRWTVGAVAWALIGFWFVEYLGTLPVTKVDASLLLTRQPSLVGRAIAHILRGSMSRAVLAALVALIALSLLWIVVASIGRAATVRALLDHFRESVFRNIPSETHDADESRPLPSLIGLNFLRAAVTLAAFLAFVGAAVLVSFASPDANPQPGMAFLLFLPIAGVICMVWSALNWMLSVAAIFSVRDGEDALGALSAAVTFFRERLGPISAVSTWIGLAHLTAFGVAGSAVSLTLAFIHVAPLRLVIAGIILVTLVYFAFAAWLYMVRLAGYVWIAEIREGLAEYASLPGPLLQTSVDRDEPILSDVPNLVVGT